MSVIIRLQNLPLTASSIDIRNFFHGLSIPDGGVHIVGGINGDSFIAFSTDEDARQAMRLSGQHLKDSRVSLLLSSRNEMYKVIEQARLTAIGGPQASSLPPSSSSAMSPQNANNPPSHLASQSQQGSSSNGHGHMQHQHQHPHYQQHHNIHNSNPMSPTSSGSSANDYLKGFSGNTSTGSGNNTASADLSSNPALLFSTMSSIPSATLGGTNANPYLSHQGGQGFPGIP
ncbi:RNA-binding protein 12, partial [Orchesella cincta]